MFSEVVRNKCLLNMSPPPKRPSYQRKILLSGSSDKTVRAYTILHCAKLPFPTLHYPSLTYPAPPYTKLPCSTLHYPTLSGIAMRYPALPLLPHTTLHDPALPCNTLHYPVLPHTNLHCPALFNLY